jgi:hypothetical protein
MWQGISWPLILVIFQFNLCQIVFRLFSPRHPCMPCCLVSSGICCSSILHHSSNILSSRRRSAWKLMNVWFYLILSNFNILHLYGPVSGDVIYIYIYIYMPCCLVSSGICCSSILHHSSNILSSRRRSAWKLMNVWFYLILSNFNILHLYGPVSGDVIYIYIYIYITASY